jgi:hypothetical protein
VGRFYQQTFINTYSKWSKPDSTGSVKLHASKRPLRAPFCSMIDAAFLAEQGMCLTRILATGGYSEPADQRHRAPRNHGKSSGDRQHS